MKRILTFSTGAAAVLTAMVFCGCSLLPEPRQSRIEYYDLKPPRQPLKSFPVEVEQFVNFSGERQRMLRRKHDTLVVSSDFYKWMESPGAMFTRYLRLVFSRNLQDPAFLREQAAVLRGEVLIFEICNREAVLGIRYHLKFGKQIYSKTVIIREKMSADTAEAFAEAMSRAADRFARTIAAEIGKLAEKGK